MKSERSQHRIQAWQFQNVLLEHHCYAPGSPETDEPHCHPDYQLCLSVNSPGTYSYRGSFHIVPAESLSVIHPGEMHFAADPEERVDDSHYLIFYLPPHLVGEAFRSCGGKGRGEPFFVPIAPGSPIFHSLVQLHKLLGSSVSLLEQETRLQCLLVDLVRHHAHGLRDAMPIRSERAYIQNIKTYLRDNYAHNVSLADLAALVGLNPYYLCQAFRQEVGIPLHLYQTQLRIERAKRLLTRGMAIGDVALEVGFYDQSHFGRHFRRLVGVTPARYATLKTS